MWNAWTAPPGALPRDYDPWACEAHCARCGELEQDCHCDEERLMTLPELIDAFDKHWEAEVAGGIEDRFNMMERLAIGVFAQWVAEEYDVTPKPIERGHPHDPDHRTR
jgi:hypothetical protein